MTLISNGQLPECLSQSKGRELAESTCRAHDARKIVVDQFAAVLRVAQGALLDIMSQLDPVVRLDIVVSINILCHSLARIIKVTLRETIQLRSPSFLGQFERIMIARNWCPSRISELAHAINTPIGYLASLLPFL